MDIPVLLLVVLSNFVDLPVKGVNAKRWASISNLWPEGVVPYKIAKSVQFSDSKGDLQNAMDLIQQDTCIKFVPRTNEANFVQISAGLDCNSPVGRLGNEQVLVLQIPFCLERRKLLRQLMHLLGLPTEHLRPDRDDFIKINWDNVSKLDAPLFMKLNSTTLPLDVLPYDYNAITHADATYHGINTTIPTIIPLQEGVVVGRASGLSTLDVMKLNLLYC